MGRQRTPVGVPRVPPGRNYPKPAKAGGPSPSDRTRPMLSPTRGKQSPVGKGDDDLPKYEESDEKPGDVDRRWEELDAMPFSNISETTAVRL